MKRVMMILMMAVAIFALRAQQTQDEYRQVMYGRADKIVKTLNIESVEMQDFIKELIATQYIDLGKINDEYAAKEKEIKAMEISKEEKTALLDKAFHFQRYQLQAKHYYFVSQLDANLNYEQVEKVKDGMTMGVYPKTLQAHLEMIPSLKPEEIAYIKAALKEAREYAMDCSDSKVKHAWFGKYKGRINNYLSKRGYDLKKEREAWNERIKQAEAQKNK
ncbi:MAG: DUF3826 domain-containing protein [Bacteroidales bacterium]|nr:DUF3826 domain-containing protein [Bacteroidales bacterium]MBO5977736.1 DUF3826 domain-containing protein [Bacteroidales bacterium]MBO7325379.1 DUF3826 domain-containing protein [Bacteroidales bacterium]